MQSLMPWITPEIITTAAAFLLILIEIFAPSSFLRRYPRLHSYLALFAILLATLITILIPHHTQTYWEEQYLWNESARFIKIVFLILGFCITHTVFSNPRHISERVAEYHALSLLAITGFLLLPSAQSFLTLFVALELVTVILYVLIAYQREKIPSLEAGVKYLISGAIASAFLIMGIAYLFGFTGSLQFHAIAAHPIWNAPPPPLWAAVFLIIAALAFKAGLVPFHAWVPDVYQGTNHSTTALLATASKASGIFLLFILFSGPLSILRSSLPITSAMLILATFSILIGTFSALHQQDIRRLLAYAGISHAGYMALPMAHLDPAGQAATLIYLISYLLATLSAFIVIPQITPANDASLSTYLGLAKRRPIYAIALTVALTSMAGIPPLIGFTGKWLVFAHLWQHEEIIPLLIAIIAAVVALAYYLAIIRTLFTSPQQQTNAPSDQAASTLGASQPASSFATTLLVTALTAAIIILGLWPQPIIRLVAQIASS